jgi:GntR family transcriptional regulator
MKPQKYRQIADDLRDQILSGRLEPGARIPTHEALMTRWRTTGMTVRRALAELESELLIETRPTVGTFVRNQQRHRLELGPGSLTAFSPTYSVLNDRFLAKLATPATPLSQTMDVDRVVPPLGVADRLRTGASQVILQHRVFYVGDDRVSLSNTYFPEHLVAGSPIEEVGHGDFQAFDILEDLGLRADDLEWDLFVRNATAAESREMRWPASLPVLGQLCTAYTADNVPVGCWVIILPGDRLLLTERCHRTSSSNIRAVS